MFAFMSVSLNVVELKMWNISEKKSAKQTKKLKKRIKMRAVLSICKSFAYFKSIYVHDVPLK